jgi:hypothetical protein
MCVRQFNDKAVDTPPALTISSAPSEPCMIRPGAFFQLPQIRKRAPRAAELQKRGGEVASPKRRGPWPGLLARTQPYDHHVGT